MAAEPTEGKCMVEKLDKRLAAIIAKERKPVPPGHTRRAMVKAGMLHKSANRKKTAQDRRLARMKKHLSTSALKTGRNEPCPCKSGLKYKKCYMLGKCDRRFQVKRNIKP